MYFLLKFWILICVCFSPFLFGKVNEGIDRESNIEDIGRRLDQIEAGIFNFNESLENNWKFDLSYVPTESLKRVSAYEALKLNQKKRKPAGKDYSTPFLKKNSLKNFYILPFVGMQTTSNLEFETFGGSVEANLKNGLSTGVQFGYNWHNFFAEFQLSYHQNNITGINQALKMNGEIDGLGFHFSSGARINFNEAFSSVVGVGAGGTEQKIQFSLSGTSFEKKDFLFSSNLFLGIEFTPVDQLILGLRYRYIFIDDMDSFSTRYLNSLELSAGYLF